MPSRPAPGTAYVRAAMYASADMKEMQNDYWYSVSSGSVDPSLDGTAIGTALRLNMVAEWGNVMPSTAIYRGLAVEVSDGTLTIGTDVYLTYPGSQLDQPAPEDVSVIVQKQTTHPGKAGRGRWYFGQFARGFIEGSYLSTAGRTLFEALAVKLKSPVTVVATGGSITLSPAHFSPKTGMLYPIHNDPVIGLLGTSRRRRGPF